MRWLKFIVILLGGLIVCGVALLGYGFYKKTTQPDWSLFSTPEQLAPTYVPTIGNDEQTGPLPAFGDLKLDLAPGCFIKHARPHEKRLYITLAPKETCNKVIVIDVTNGRTLGTISAAP